MIPDDDDRATSGLWLGFWFVFGLEFGCWVWVGLCFVRLVSTVWPNGLLNAIILCMVKKTF